MVELEDLEIRRLLAAGRSAQEVATEVEVSLDRVTGILGNSRV